MAYVNTGYERSLVMRIDRATQGVSLSGYPKIYDGKTAFSTYQVITDDELSKLGLSEYNQRLTDFQNYVSAIEGIVDFSAQVNFGDEARRINETACPINQ